MWIAAGTTDVAAQRASYPADEFSDRRGRLCEALGADGLALFFGASMPGAAARFRQDNDFFYLSGIEHPNAALVIDLASCRAHLLLPAQNESQRRVDGPNPLGEPGAAEVGGFASLRPLRELEELLARRLSARAEPLHVRLSERDEVDMSRGDKALYVARRQRASFGAQLSEDAFRVKLLRERYPRLPLRDVSPALDRLRTIKSSREIEVLRRNGRVSAAALRRAIEATRPGAYEYQLEAEATHEMIAAGADGPAYAAIVGSGPNVNTWHYNRNDRALSPGGLVVMDYGASFGYLTMDITRTWPVSGRFDEQQRRAYDATLEAQKAVIAAMRPGATRAETREVCGAVLERWGFADQLPCGAGHFVGLAVHDVGDHEAPFEPGMVIAVEPIIEIPEAEIHVRIEDTVLITQGAPEVLSGDVPKEREELLALVGRAAR